MSFKLAHRAECETIGNWQLVRRTLELQAFGINIVEIAAGRADPRARRDSIATRRRSSSCSAASPTLVIDGEDHAAPAGTFARLDPEHKRTVRNDAAEPAERADRLGAALERIRADGVGMSAHRRSELRETIDAYNDAWNAHDVERIASMHAPDMVFENHTAGERAEGEQALGAHRAASSSRGPTSSSRRAGCTCARTWSCRSGRPARRTSSR